MSGIFGTINRFYPNHHFQHTAPVQPSNSGGPVFDSVGNVIDVVVAVRNQSITIEGSPTAQDIDIPPNQNVNFAIDLQVIEEFLKENGITSVTDASPIPKKKYTKKQKKFTVPVLCFINKGQDPLPLIEIGIAGLNHSSLHTEDKDPADSSPQ